MFGQNSVSASSEEMKRFQDLQNQINGQRKQNLVYTLICATCRFRS